METGTHADEIETSNLLLMRPELVDMKKAEDDTTASKRGTLSLTPVPAANSNYSKSGIFGYATLATKEKGRQNAASVTKQMLADIDSVRRCSLPQPKDGLEELFGFGGIYKSADGKEMVITPRKYYLDYSWNKIDHSTFFRLSSYGTDRFGSPLLDVLFVRNEAGQVQKALINFRGQSAWLTKQ